MLVSDLAVDSDAGAKKFGTFLGVFTPSILTILGVIMYRRFGWVVGHSGLVGALGVVALAHVISVTTGLSVASIATNHKVGTGGNYYIISRSLGLSIGGAIGLALYVALALGVSLYLIGLAETVLELKSIAELAESAGYAYDPKNVPANYLRVVGSLALALLAALTLLSTSLALKSQLLVLTLIGLSLLSIFTGSEVSLESAVDMPAPKSFVTVFAVFFPAVTGFTAGVGMSGDLEDPKRAIPRGTMAAIVVGLAIYIILMLFIAQKAPVELLRTDNDILSKIARWSWMVPAGAMAAMVSSALGSILGAPRTLQALAIDGLAPKIFARGRAEPRVALVATVLIAEAGILVGELELVGEVISMFFLTCYGSLCLACGLERWASSDFRPQFKVPIWISLLGAMACFLVMFQINAAAMFVAILVMALLYAFFKRRQLVLGSGDTWGGVWSAVVRLGLQRLRHVDEGGVLRNWRPNMILLTRRSPLRPTQIDFARHLVGDRGILTHFDLVVGGPPKARVDPELEDRYPGMFARVQGCDDVFEDIPDIATNFGFVGMETNTVMLGWPRDAGRNASYTRMISRLVALDLSTLMLRVDPDRGFGARHRIDIWWDGVAPTGQLMLTLAHLLQSSADWKDARVRVLVNARKGVDPAPAKKRLHEIVVLARISAEGVLLAPLPDEEDLADRIRKESAFADLVMIHAREPGEGQEFVALNDGILQALGTAILVRPASVFADAAVIFDEDAPELAPAPPPGEWSLPEAPAPELAPPLHRLELQLVDSLERFRNTVQDPSIEEEQAFLRSIVGEVETIRQLYRRLGRRGVRRDTARGLVEWAKGRFGSAVVEQAQGFVAASRSRKVEGRDELVLETAWEGRLREGIARLRRDLSDILVDLPATVNVETEPDDWASAEGDPVAFAWLKLRVRLAMRMFSPRPPPRRVPLRAVAAHHLRVHLLAAIEESSTAIGQRRLEALRRARGHGANVIRYFAHVISDLDRSVEPSLDVRRFGELLLRELETLEDTGRDVVRRFEAEARESRDAVTQVVEQAASAVVADLAKPTIGYEARIKKTSSPASTRAALAIETLPARWSAQHAAMSSALRLDAQVEALGVEARRAVTQLQHRIRRELDEGPIKSIARANEVLTSVREALTVVEDEEVSSDLPRIATSADAFVDEGSAEGALSDQRRRAKARRRDAETDVDSGSEPPGPTDDLKDTYLIAADELRATWADPYRPDVRDLIDQLLAGLGRAADRVPDIVVTLTEAGLDAADARQEAPSQFAVRRAAQAFLERVVAQPVRERLRTLPGEVDDAQGQLVDAVRLVAFNLEQEALGEHPDDAPSDEDETLISADILGERIARLEAASAQLDVLADALRSALIDETTKAMSTAREAVLGGVPGAVAAPAGRIQKVGGDVAEQVRQALKEVEGRVGTVGALVKKPAKGQDLSIGTVADELHALRSALVPHPEVQGSLPLVYRRIFGRAPLETADMLRGRDAEVAALERAVARWSAGQGGPIAILGHPRSGKTTLATVMTRELLTERTIVRVAPHGAGTSAVADLNAAVARAVGAREGQSAEIALRGMAPGAVLVVDDLGRWVERRPGGLAALQLWLRLWRRLAGRHLFVVTATPYVWRYASELLPLEETLLDTVKCQPVSRAALRDLLDVRHKTSDFALEFARDGRSLLRGGADENRQLRRLYERSRGNVGEAVELWRRSIVEVGERRVTLAVQDEPDASVLDRLSTRWYAALAATAFHRSLSGQRMSRVMRLSREEATGLMGDLERAGLVTTERAGRAILDPVLQPLVLRALKRRGLVL